MSYYTPYEVIGAWCGVILGGLTFVGAWIYCIATYGFLLGVGLGWLPAAICGVVMVFAMRFLWPLAAVALVILLGLITTAATHG